MTSFIISITENKYIISTSFLTLNRSIPKCFGISYLVEWSPGAESWSGVEWSLGVESWSRIFGVESWSGVLEWSGFWSEKSSFII